MPINRSPPATRAAMPRATRALRNNFIVGLTRIELVTSPLSGVRSNQLSYSPGANRTVTLPLGRRSRENR